MSLIIETQKLIQLYKKGFFPMAKSRESEEINFYKPIKRFIIPIYQFHIPKNLFNDYKKQKYQFFINKNFKEIIINCSLKRKKDNQTWINKTIVNTYCKLHIEKYAHSIECFDGPVLVGGLYGVHIGSCFFGESMFSLKKNTSKFCLLYLISILVHNKFKLLDSQFYNKHLLQFGAYELDHNKYEILLDKYIKRKSLFKNNFDYSQSISILQSLTQTS